MDFDFQRLPIRTVVKELKRKSTRSKRKQLEILIVAEKYLTKVVSKLGQRISIYELILQMEDLVEFVQLSLNMMNHLYDYPDMHITNMIPDFRNALTTLVMYLIHSANMESAVLFRFTKGFLKCFSEVAIENPTSWFYITIISDSLRCILLSYEENLSEPEKTELRSLLSNFIYTLPSPVLICGDYCCQYLLTQILHCFLTSQPESNEQNDQILKKIFPYFIHQNCNMLLTDDRFCWFSFLNLLNSTSNYERVILSFPVLHLMIGKSVIKSPLEFIGRSFCVNFSYISQRMHFFATTPENQADDINIRIDQIESVCIYMCDINIPQLKGAYILHIHLSVDIIAITESLADVDKECRSLFLIAEDNKSIHEVVQRMKYPVHQYQENFCQYPHALLTLYLNLNQQNTCPDTHEMTVASEIEPISENYAYNDNESHDELHVESQDGLNVESQDELHVESQDELNVESQDELHVESQDELNVESQDELHVGSQDELNVESQDELHVESQDELNVESQDELNVESQDELHVESRNELHAAFQNELHIESQDIESQDELHVESEAELHVESQAELNVESQDELHNESQQDELQNELHNESPQDEVHNESPQDEVHTESPQDEVHNESPQDEVHNESQDEVHNESQDEVHNESPQDEVSNDYQDEVHNESQEDEVHNDYQDEVHNESQEEVHNESQDEVHIESGEEGNEYLRNEIGVLMTSYDTAFRFTRKNGIDPSCSENETFEPLQGMRCVSMNEYVHEEVLLTSQDSYNSHSKVVEVWESSTTIESYHEDPFPRSLRNRNTDRHPPLSTSTPIKVVTVKRRTTNITTRIPCYKRSLEEESEIVGLDPYMPDFLNHTTPKKSRKRKQTIQKTVEINPKEKPKRGKKQSKSIEEPRNMETNAFSSDIENCGRAKKRNKKAACPGQKKGNHVRKRILGTHEETPRVTEICNEKRNSKQNITNAKRKRALMEKLPSEEPRKTVTYNRRLPPVGPCITSSDGSPNNNHDFSMVETVPFSEEFSQPSRNVNESFDFESTPSKNSKLSTIDLLSSPIRRQFEKMCEDARGELRDIFLTTSSAKEKRLMSTDFNLKLDSFGTAPKSVRLTLIGRRTKKRKC